MPLIDCLVFKQQEKKSHSLLNIIVITFPLPYTETLRIYLTPLTPFLNPPSPTLARDVIYKWSQSKKKAIQ